LASASEVLLFEVITQFAEGFRTFGLADQDVTDSRAEQQRKMWANAFQNMIIDSIN
jgi:hypothetical protein